MARSTSYFLSRVNKGGILTTEGIRQAILQAEEIEYRESAWTIIEAEAGTVSHARRRTSYIVATIVKYDPFATVEVVDARQRKVLLQREPNLQRAACRFVYFPSFEIMGHQRIWNQISPSGFRNRMRDLVTAFHNDFFVECNLKAIADHQLFIKRLAGLEKVNGIKTSVRPPNPLFSPFWKSLKDYLRKRKLKLLKLDEVAKGGQEIETSLLEILKRIESNNLSDEKPPDIGDAAVLMAADGYGTASISGQRKNQRVVIRTSQNEMQVKLAVEISNRGLAKAIFSEVMHMEQVRRLRH